jgi:phenylpropionate dioxygenase-like ring-hydroxylating dioxygenase large terminal subunit
MKMKPNDDRNELEYLKSLVILMMKADSRRGAVDNERSHPANWYTYTSNHDCLYFPYLHPDTNNIGLLRKVPTLNINSTNKRGSRAERGRGIFARRSGTGNRKAYVT